MDPAKSIRETIGESNLRKIGCSIVLSLILFMHVYFNKPIFYVAHNLYIVMTFCFVTSGLFIFTLTSISSVYRACRIVMGLKEGVTDAGHDAINVSYSALVMIGFSVYGYIEESRIIHLFFTLAGACLFKALHLVRKYPEAIWRIILGKGPIEKKNAQ